LALLSQPLEHGGPPQPVYVTRGQAKVLGLVKDELQ